MADISDDSENNEAEVIQETKMEKTNEKELKDNYNSGAGDGFQAKAEGNVENILKDPNLNTELSMEDVAYPKSQPSTTSMRTLEELEQRMNLRLQKLAEFESFDERAENSNDNAGSSDEKPPTWKEFWKNVESQCM